MTALLQLMCLAQGVNVDPLTIETLVDDKRGDIRSCIHTLQFWCSTTNSDTTSTSSSDVSMQRVDVDLAKRLQAHLSMFQFKLSDGDLNKASTISSNKLTEVTDCNM